MDILGELGREDDSSAAEGEGEEEEMAVMPDFFSAVRPLLLRGDGSHRPIVRACRWMLVWGLVVWPVEVMHQGIRPAGFWPSPMAQMRFALMGIPFCAGLVYVRFLADVLHPTNGALALLGMGLRKVPARKLKSLDRWRWLLLLPTAGCLVFAAGVFQFGVDCVGALVRRTPCSSPDIPYCDINVGVAEAPCCFLDETFVKEKQAYFAPGMPPPFFSLLLGYPAAMAWYFSMKCAVVLSMEEVTNVVRCTTKAALADDETWKEQVAAPSIALATCTMPQLSNGYGSGTGISALLFAIITILNFVGTVHDIRIGSADGVAILRRATGVACGVLAPFFLALDAANVSSRADQLMKRINNLRLDWSSTDLAKGVHSRVYPLQVTLKELNHGQGLGFTIFTKVVDKKTLNLLGISIASFFATVIPLIMAFLPDPPTYDGEDAECIETQDALRVCAELSRIVGDVDGECVLRNATLDELLRASGH